VEDGSVWPKGGQSEFKGARQYWQTIFRGTFSPAQCAHLMVGGNGTGDLRSSKKIMASFTTHYPRMTVLVSKKCSAVERATLTEEISTLRANVAFHWFHFLALVYWAGKAPPQGAPADEHDIL
jgi:hypothetical protein